MEPLLFLVHRIPLPPNKGDKIRSYHLLKALARRYRIFLGTFLDDPEDRVQLPRLRDLCADAKVVEIRRTLARAHSLIGLIRGQPLTLPYYHDAELARWVRDVVQEQRIGKALVFSSAMAQYLADVPSVDAVVDFVDVDSAKWTEYGQRRPWPVSLIYRREGRLLLEFERRTAARAIAACFVTPDEEALFKRLAPGAGNTLAVGNGVDSEYFAPSHPLPSPYAPGERAVVFTGAMDYWPNVDAVSWFAREVLPLVRARHPEVRFYIVGMNPAGTVAALAGESVVVTGRVHDVRPYLAHAGVAVAPLRLARGVQNKVLEAMAMARPVVATEAAVTGLLVTRGDQIAVADDAPAFARNVIDLLDPERGARMGAQARAAVVRGYSWAANLAPLETVLSGIASPGRRRGEGAAPTRASEAA